MTSGSPRPSRTLASLLRTTFTHRCPACGDGRLFRTGYELHRRCPGCGQDLVGADGAQYGGPIVLGYTVAGIAGLGTIGLLWWRLGYANWQLWVSIAVTCAAVFLTFRHCKASWTWVLWATGQLDGGGEAGDGGDGWSGDGGGGGRGPERGPPPRPVEMRRRVRIPVPGGVRGGKRHGPERGTRRGRGTPAGRTAGGGRARARAQGAAVASRTIAATKRRSASGS